MSDSPTCTVGAVLATRLRDARNQIASRWLERIAARVSLPRDAIFPTDDLLDHVPLLIEGVAAYLETADTHIDDDVPVVAKARELGAMRHAQGFDVYQILKEHQLLGAIILSFLEETVDDIDVACSKRELVSCFRRAEEAIEIVRQATTNHFLQLSAARVREREDRLRRFNRMVSHELRNRVTAIRGAASLLEEEWLDREQQTRFRHMVIENADALHQLLENLESLSRLESDSRQQRNILLPQAAAEVARQLRGQAQAREVDVRIADNLPAIEVNAAAVELCLANYISNAIKYSDGSKAQRWVEVTGEFRPREASGGGGELVVRVRDNGIGVPAHGRERLFQHFYRAHDETVTDVSGSGLGLSIVRETAESLGGSAWAEFPAAGGTVFAFSLPSRREEDAAAAGVTRTTKDVRPEGAVPGSSTLEAGAGNG
jgi:signal transduction histidine kinase